MFGIEGREGTGGGGVGSWFRLWLLEDGATACAERIKVKVRIRKREKESGDKDKRRTRHTHLDALPKPPHQLVPLRTGRSTQHEHLLPQDRHRQAIIYPTHTRNTAHQHRTASHNADGA